MTLDELGRVWTPMSSALAVVAGVAYGLAVGWVAVNPAYSTNTAGPLRVGFLAMVFAASAGLAFFALQALGSYLSDDPLWYRVMSRYGQWILFSLAIGVTTAARVQRDRMQRHRIAHGRAMHELADDQRRADRDPFQARYRGEGDH